MFSAALLTTAVLVAALQLHDHHQTLSHEQFLNAITTFRPDIHPSDINVQDANELASDAIATEPAQCHLVVDLNPAGALDAASWAPSNDRDITDNVQASRYADPTTARHAYAAIRRAAFSCHQATAPASGNQDGGQITVTNVDTDTRSKPYRLRYTVRLEDTGTQLPADTNIEFTINVLRYGNTLVWTFTPTNTHTDSHSPIDDLVNRMRTLTR